MCQNNEGYVSVLSGRLKSVVMVVAALMAMSVVADTRYPMSDSCAKANRDKVLAFAKDAYWKGTPLAACAVEAMSGIRRTPDLFPVDGDFIGSVRIVAAQDEYESGSFLVYGFEDVENVTFEPEPLVSRSGGTIPAGAIDLKVVKVWYQQGSAWGSFFSDMLRRIPTPELLLKDETLVDTDHETKENFLRCDYGSLTVYRWISCLADHVDHGSAGEPEPKWIRDAATLQPVVVRRNEFKQLMFALHVPAGTKGGVYRGKIAVKVGGKTAFGIPVAVRVLPFALPAPATFRDLNRPFYASCYTRDANLDVNRKLASNLARHGVKNPLLGHGGTVRTKAQVRSLYRTMSECGLDTKTLFCVLPSCNVMTDYPASEEDAGYPKYKSAVQAASNALVRVREVFGKDVKTYAYGIDEGGPETVRAERSTWKRFHELGANVCVATRYHKYLLFNCDFPNIPRQPRPSSKVWAGELHAACPDTLVGWYADPHSGPENPDYTRRVYGWGTWRNDYDAFCQYILCRYNWNDFYVPAEAFLRGLMLVYPAADGDIIDTIAWEGVREAVDDIRYGTCLKQLCAQGFRAKDVETQYVARAASSWLAQVDCERSSLDFLRKETIVRILDLRTRLGLDGRRGED